jgi:hypothetical protein
MLRYSVWVSFEPLVAVAAALVLFAALVLPGGRDVRRIASIVGIIALAGVTIFVLLAGPRADPEAGTPGMSLPGLSSPAPSGATPPAASAGAADPSGSPTVLRHEVSLAAGAYSVFTVDPQGTLTGERAIRFDEPSRAPVDRVEAPNGLIHWRTVGGGYTGWSYVAGRSGPFIVREVLRWPDGEIGYREVGPGS